MESTCDAHDDPGKATVPYPNGIELNDWFKRTVGLKHISLLARVLYEMYVNDLVEILDSTGAPLCTHQLTLSNA